MRVIPVGEGHRDAAQELAEQLDAATASRSTTPTRPSASGSANAEVEKIPFVIVYGDKESDESLAIREHGGGQSPCRWLISGPNLLP